MVNKKKAIICWLLVIIWMIIIFSFSQNNSNQSSSKSREVVTKIVDVLEKKKTKEEKTIIVEKIHIPFRKFAHGFEYAVLCLLLLIALNTSGINGKKQLLLAIIICILYASTDEFHQTLISGRSGEIRDVLIDSLGSFIGLLIYKITTIIKKKLKH